MKKNILATLLLVIFTAAISINAKDKKGIIMTVDGEEIPTDEFLYLFQKNNQQQSEPQSLDDYLQLFEIYRLKVAEAKRQGVDTLPAFKKEIATYKRELLEPYVTDSTFFNHLVDIAAEREKTEVESSHIMIVHTHDAAKDSLNLVLLDSIRNELLNGADFIEMAKTYSQDRFSSQKGGYLGFNPAGTFPYGFETAVYETPEGGISEIIESHVGWHIVKSGARRPAMDFNRPEKTYEEIRKDVERKSTSPFDSRYHEIRARRLNDLKEKHKDLALRLAKVPDEDAYEVLMEAEENLQYKTNPEYRNLVDEYINGSLLYEVSVENIWDKAANDDESLQAYYEKNKGNYFWDNPHAKGILVEARNDSIGTLIKEAIKDLPSDSIVPYIRANFKKDASVEKFNLAKGSNAMIDNLVFGEDTEFPQKNNHVYFVIENRIVEQPEEFNDVRGMVVTDYQEVLEKDWVNNLKETHAVEVNHKELDRVRKKLK